MPNERTKPDTIGFGFDPNPQRAYHFAVVIPRNASDDSATMRVEERFALGEEYEQAAQQARLTNNEPGYVIRPPQTKIEIAISRWQRVQEDVKTDFNRRLRGQGLKASGWKTGENLLAPYLGKELTLLLWAIEDADPSYIPNAVANWQGLAPEERWWLYTTINAATGHATDGRGRGWRKAIGIAFTENPATQTRNYFTQSPTPISRDRQSDEGPNRRAALNGKRGKKAQRDGETLSMLALDDPVETADNADALDPLTTTRRSEKHAV